MRTVLTTILLLCGLASPSAVRAGAAGDEAGAAGDGGAAQSGERLAWGTTISVGGRTLTGPFSMPQRRGGRLLLPVVSIARALGDQITVDASGRAVEVRRQTGTRADFRAALNQVRENNAVVLVVSDTAGIDFPPDTSALMLPVEIVSALLDVSVVFDEEAGIVRVARGGQRQASPVTTGARRAPLEVYGADYDYNFNAYPTAFNHSLTLRSYGRLGNGRFNLMLNSDGGTGTGFGSLRQGNLTYELPGGQRFIFGDFGTGTDLVFLSSNVRGAWLQTPFTGARATLFGGRSVSGIQAARPSSLVPSTLTPEEQARQDELDRQARASFRYDTTVRGGYLTFGPSASDPHRRNVLLFSAGGADFSGPGRRGQMMAASVRASSRSGSLQGDIGAGRFSGARADGTRVDGTGLAADFSGSFNLRENLTLNGRYVSSDENFLGIQADLLLPRRLVAGGVTWRPKEWLTASFSGSDSSGTLAAGQRERFFSGSVNLTPRDSLWPTVFLSHTQTTTTQTGSGSYTLFNATKDYSRWTVFTNAMRVKSLGPAFLNVQAGARVRLDESNVLQFSQSVGRGGALGGTADWSTPSLFSRRINFGAGFSYARGASSPFSASGRLSASLALPFQQTVQLVYGHNKSGGQLFVSMRGPLLFGHKAEAGAAGLSVKEMATYGTFSGRVYQDTDLNGRYDAATDVPQANVTVRVDGSAYAVTDREGQFKVLNVKEGEHEIYLDLLSVRADLTILDSQTQRAALRAEAETIVDFRLVRTGRIAGTVWHDIDGDGRQDEGESSLPDVRIVTGSGRDTLTDENGAFVIADLPPGVHVVLIDEKTLPDNTTVGAFAAAPEGQRQDDAEPSRGTFAAGSRQVTVRAGRETGGLNFAVITRPVEVKRFD